MPYTSRFPVLGLALGLTRPFSLLFLVVLLAGTPAGHAADEPATSPPCDAAAHLGPNDTWRSTIDDDVGSFVWHFPSPGLATVDLLSHGTSHGSLELRARDCSGHASRALVIERSADRLTLAVRAAGSVVLIADADRRPYRLETNFVPTDVVAEELAWTTPPEPDTGLRVVHTSFLAGRGATTKTEPEIIDPDPDGLAAPDRDLVASVLTLQPTEHRKTEPEIIDPDPDGLAAPGGGSAPAALHRVMLYEPTCRRRVSDDHGDTIACATPLPIAHTAVGQLGNAFGDDRDVFSFELDEVETVTIAATVTPRVAPRVAPRDPAATERAPVETWITLTDAAGRRLARRASSTGQHLRLVTTLAPGDFSVQMNGAADAYALTVTVGD